MKKLVMMLMAASLLICAGPYGRTDPVSDAAKKDKLEAARQAEEKGDLARIHNNYALAISSYQTALRVSRQNAVLYNKLGIVELQLGERGMARKNFSQALKYDPQFTSAVNNLGAVALLDKRYKPAANYFKQALAMDESVASTHLNLAEAWMGMGETDRAMTEYARALELDADILSSNQDGVIAQVATPEQRARIAFMIAKLYMKRGNLDGALESLRTAKALRYADLAKVYTDPAFTALWPDPRLAKIIKR
jgi:tetratricopeptide (TPR) repeat protein